jgi:hypothetical protein
MAVVYALPNNAIPSCYTVNYSPTVKDFKAPIKKAPKILQPFLLSHQNITKIMFNVHTPLQLWNYSQKSNDEVYFKCYFTISAYALGLKYHVF